MENSPANQKEHAVDFEKKLDQVLSILTKFVGGLRNPLDDDDTPKFNDPTKYDRACKIEDGDLLMMITEADMSLTKARTMHAEYDLAMSESKTLSKRLFLRLAKMYPSVGAPLHAGVGYRKYKGDYYYVSWDNSHEEEADSPNEPTIT